MSSRSQWNEAVASAQIGLEPVKVQRTSRITNVVRTFWELAVTINGRPVQSDGEFRSAFKTRTLALAGVSREQDRIRTILLDSYFDTVDAPETDYVQAVLS